MKTLIRKALPFAPEPLDALRERYPAAVAELVDSESGVPHWFFLEGN